MTRLKNFLKRLWKSFVRTQEARAKEMVKRRHQSYM